jgi:F-type H+-transporting ATPase subunit gamma
MTRLAEIEGHIAGMSALQNIVGAMRSLAGMRVQEAQRALPGIRLFAQSMVSAIASALPLVGPTAGGSERESGARALILCLGEHGFVGGFNERLIDAAVAALRPSDRVFALGSRGAALAIERGIALVRWRPMATRLSGAPEIANGLAAELYARIPTGEIASVEVVFARYRQGNTSSIEHSALFPLDPRRLEAPPAAEPPMHNLEPQLLVEKLIADYVFARLTEAIVESVVAENAARFAAMEQASENVSKRLDDLRQSARQARQSEITEELLDLVTGTEALTKHGKSAPHHH